MCVKCEFLRKDFETLAERLTEEYRPQDLAGMAYIGIVLQTLENLHIGKHDEKALVLAAAEPMAAVPHHDEAKEDIEYELEGAEKYYQRYHETKDTSYKAMSKDRLKNADYLLKHARMTTIDPTAQAKIQHYTARYNILLNKLSSGG